MLRNLVACYLTSPVMAVLLAVVPTTQVMTSTSSYKGILKEEIKITKQSTSVLYVACQYTEVETLCQLV